MKRILLSVFSLVFSVAAMYGQQQVACVNTQKILEKLPEYTEARQKLDNLKSQYETTISAEMKKVEILYNSYQSQKSSLSEPQREAKESEIIAKERAVKELQKTYLGQDGELTKTSAQLLDPLKQKVNGAIVSVAEEMKILFIFDISSEQGLLYYSPKSDVTSAVLKKLNIKENQ